MTKQRPKIAVLGSINMDLMIQCDHLPCPGETLLADRCTEVSGGKGANQAVAAALCGAVVNMIGRVGDDAFGPRLLDQLQSEGVRLTGVASSINTSSGLAVVSVDRNGENSIVVVPGANGLVSEADVEEHRQLIVDSDVILLQLEIPPSTCVAAIRLAREAGVRVIMNPAPVHSGINADIFGVDLLCPNQTEAGMLLGRSIENRNDAISAVRELASRGPNHVIITLGADGVVWGDSQQSQWMKAFPIRSVDTTAAGDAFVGSLAVFWAETGNLEIAIRHACAAGAIAATRSGAQPSLPQRDEVVSLAQIVVDRS